MATAKGHRSKVLAALKKKLGSTSSRLAREGSSSDVTECVPTGIEVLDHYILGPGGIPVGRYGEIFSDEGAGKTSLGFAILAAFQRAGGDAYLIETENALQASRMDAFGVDRDALVLIEPATLEEALNAFKVIVDTLPGDRPSVILWDSIAATELAAQASADFGEAKIVGKRGKLMSEALPVLCTQAMKKRAAIIAINQLREKIGVFFGDTATTPGGNASKFQASWRLRLWKGGVYPKGADPEGHHVTIKAVKNKVGYPHRKAKVRLNYVSGWENEWSLLELAKEKGVLSNKRARVSEKTMKEARVGLGFPGASDEDETDST